MVSITARHDPSLDWNDLVRIEVAVHSHAAMASRIAVPISLSPHGRRIVRSYLKACQPRLAAPMVLPARFLVGFPSAGVPGPPGPELRESAYCPRMRRTGGLGQDRLAAAAARHVEDIP